MDGSPPRTSHHNHHSAGANPAPQMERQRTARAILAGTLQTVPPPVRKFMKEQLGLTIDYLPQPNDLPPYAASWERLLTQALFEGQEVNAIRRRRWEQRLTEWDSWRNNGGCETYEAHGGGDFGKPREPIDDDLMDWVVPLAMLFHDFYMEASPLAMAGAVGVGRP